MNPNDYILYFDYAAIGVLGIIMLHFYSRRNIRTRQNNVFSVGLILSLACTFFDIVSVKTMIDYRPERHSLVYFCNTMYLVLFQAVPAIYVYYMMLSSGKSDKLTTKDRLKINIPLIIVAFLTGVSPFTGWVFYLEEGQYFTGPLHPLHYAIAYLYFLEAAHEVIAARKRYTTKQRIGLFTFIMCAVVISGIQMIIPALLISQFLIALSILLVYLSVENPESYEDKKLHVFNYNAFRQIAARNIDSQNKLNIIMIRLNDFKFINNTVGLRNGDELLHQVTDYLNQAAGRNFFACRISGVQFALVQKVGNKPDSDGILNVTLGEVQERFRIPFLVNGISVSISSSVYKLSYPEDVKSIDDIIAAVDFLINEIHAETFEELMAKKKRENQVVRIMQDALTNKKFEVYYQLIFDNNTKSFNSAEALVRLFDEELGFIPPDEFIPLAERNGMIIGIGDYVLNQACIFLKENELWNKGINYIEVNLSAMQCMQKNWHEKLAKIVESYGLSFKHFNFEITETMDVISDDILRNSMNILISKGVSFSLDDYGTGFSNTNYITSFPYDLVKIDKKIVWDAMDNDKAMIMLKYTIAMLNEMKLRIVAEGVESLDQAQVLAELGCSLFQGYYFARPMPKEQVLKKLNESLLDKNLY